MSISTSGNNSVMQHLICLLLGGFAFLLIARRWAIDAVDNQRATTGCLSPPVDACRNTKQISVTGLGNRPW
jgi:hypothetical protein